MQEISQKRGTINKREAVKEFLQNADWQALTDWAKNERNPATTLLGGLFEEDILLRWRAIEGLAKVSAILADKKLLKAQKIVERLLGQMDEQATATIWNAPEAIAEILVNVPSLIDKHAPALISFIRLQPFEIGVNWGAFRLSTIRPDIINKISVYLEESLGSDDPHIRAFSAAALITANISVQPNTLEELKSDERKIDIYSFEASEFSHIKVQDFISTILPMK